MPPQMLVVDDRRRAPARRGPALAALLGALLVASPARAQPAPPTPPPDAPSPPPPPGPAPDDAKKQEARAHFDRGIALFEEGAWDAALAEFTRSREIYVTRAATSNAALCLQKLARYDEALDLFEALLRDYPNMPAEEKKAAERAVVELGSRVGYVEIRGA